MAWVKFHRRIGIRKALLLAVNTVLVVGFIIFVWIDYQHGLSQRLRDKEAELTEEAALVLPAVSVLRHHGDDAIQIYIDRTCAQMQDSVSPGHHISVKVGNRTYEAETHLQATPELSQAMRLAKDQPSHETSVSGRAILVGSHTQGDIEVFVSEFADHARQTARQRLIARVSAVVIIGVVLTLTVNLILIKLIIQPIDVLTRTVRTIGDGHLGSQSPRFFTAELDYLSTEVGEMSRSLGKAEHDRRAQMLKARAIQQNLLPARQTLKQAGVHHVYIPAEDVGGDFFDVKPIQQGCVAVCVGDVTGHGVPAAVGAAMLKTLFQNPASEMSDPAAVLEEVNQRFHDVSLEGDFATLFMAVIDRRTGSLVYASAGHEVGYLIRPDKRVIELSATGLPLGVDSHATYQAVRLDLEPLDKLVLLTDGLAESMSATGEQLGRGTLAQALVDDGCSAPSAIIEHLLKVAKEHRADQPQLDDITLAVIGV